MEINFKRKGRLPFFRISQKQDLLLFLIEKELHEEKVRSSLEKIGFTSEALFINDLGDLILSIVGIEVRDDNLWNWYQNLIEKYSNDLDINNRESYSEQSFKVYFELKERL